MVIGDVRERPAPGLKVKPVLERVRADGPLLPLLSLELARWISSHYLAPAAFVLRAMLPPGMLERLELVAEIRPDDSDGLPGMARDAAPDESGRPLGPADLALLAELADGPRAVRDLAAPEGRAGLLRRLRDLAARGRSTSTGRSRPRLPDRATSAGPRLPPAGSPSRRPWPRVAEWRAGGWAHARSTCSPSWPSSRPG